MRRGWWLLPALLATRVAVAHAQMCMPTAEAAAQSIVGSTAPLAVTGSGYRAQDVQVDPLMHRVWVRVGRCDAPGAPLILVPLNAALSGGPTGGTPAVQAGVVNTFAANAAPAVPFALPRPFAVHAGDAVLVTFASSAVQMELEGTAEQAGALGDTVGIVLRRRGDEPLHRMRGILRADHHVEVRQ